MTRYELGDVVLIDFPQTGSPLRKRRPALVLLDIGDLDVVVAPITSRHWTGSGDHFIRDWAAAGLKLESTVRVAKLSCLPKSDIARDMGRLTPQDLQGVRTLARSLFAF